MKGPFQNSKFRRLFAGRVVTNIGDSLYFIGAMWLVYELTEDPIYTGIAGFLTLAPAAFQFLAGPIVDRWSIRGILAVTQITQAIIVLLVPLAHFANMLEFWMVLLVMPLLTALNQLVYPAQTTALPRLLEDDDLVAANSLFSIAYQGVDMVANGIAGILIGVVGAISLFVIDAFTFGIAAILFATIIIPGADETKNTAGTEASDDVAAATDGGSVEDEETNGGTVENEETDTESYTIRLRTGLRYVRSTVLIWMILGAALVNFTFGIAIAALPVYADTIRVTGFIDPAAAYGILMASFATGNLLGAIAANVVDEKPLGWTMIISYVAGSVCWTAAIAINWLPVTAILLVFAFLPLGVVNVQVSALVQSAPPEEYVGRVSSVLGSASTVAIPVGSLAGGMLAGTVGPKTAMLGVGVGVLALALYIFLLPNLRNMPEVKSVELQPENS